ASSESEVGRVPLAEASSGSEIGRVPPAEASSESEVGRAPRSEAIGQQDLAPGSAAGAISRRRNDPVGGSQRRVGPELAPDRGVGRRSRSACAGQGKSW